MASPPSSSSNSPKPVAVGLPTKRKADDGVASRGTAPEGTSSKKARPSGPEEPAKATAGQNEGEEDDEEWLQFQREVLDAPSNDAQPAQESAAPAVAPRTQYATASNATIEAQPQLISRDEAEDGDEAAAQDEPESESEEDKRQRQAREEKEEILARLIEEQRQQDEAQER